MFKFEDDFVNKIKNRDKTAFDEFYNQTVNVFFRYLKWSFFISDSDAQDLLSSFYFKIWNNIESYKDMNNFSGWIWTVFKNLVKDYFKKSKELHFADLNANSQQNFEDNLLSDDNVDELLNTNFKIEEIKVAMKKLDETSKEIVFLKFVEEKSNEEISQTLNISHDNVRQRISRALKKLKKFLDC